MLQDGHGNEPASLPSSLQQKNNVESETTQDTGIGAVSVSNSLVMPNRPQWPHESICTIKTKKTLCASSVIRIPFFLWFGLRLWGFFL